MMSWLSRHRKNESLPSQHAALAVRSGAMYPPSFEGCAAAGALFSWVNQPIVDRRLMMMMMACRTRNVGVGVSLSRVSQVVTRRRIRLHHLVVVKQPKTQTAYDKALHTAGDNDGIPSDEPDDAVGGRQLVAQPGPELRKAILEPSRHRDHEVLTCVHCAFDDILKTDNVKHRLK